MVRKISLIIPGHIAYAFFCSDDNKTKIAQSGALVPLTRLARSKDMRVQRNATGALLNMTHSGTHCEKCMFFPCADMVGR